MTQCNESLVRAQAQRVDPTCDFHWNPLVGHLQRVDFTRWALANEWISLVGHSPTSGFPLVGGAQRVI